MEKRKIDNPRAAINLLKHGTNNNQVKPYKCEYCDKCFTQRSTCKELERTHTGLKPQCKHCEKCFAHLENCKRHEVSHTGVKRY